MVNVVEILRRKDLTDIETVLVVITMRQMGVIEYASAIPILVELLGDRTPAAIKGAKALVNSTDILDIVKEFNAYERSTGKS